MIIYLIKKCIEFLLYFENYDRWWENINMFFVFGK